MSGKVVLVAGATAGIGKETARVLLTKNAKNAILRSASYGAIAQLYAGTVADGRSLNGKYLIPRARLGTPRANTQDPEIGKKLWQYLEEQVKDV